MYNTIWHEGLNMNVGVAIFLLLWSSCYGDIKIKKYNSIFSSSLALFEAES
jgi:hypothetical protein